MIELYPFNKALKILEKEILQQGIQKLATFQIDPKSTEFSALDQSEK